MKRSWRAVLLLVAAACSESGPTAPGPAASTGQLRLPILTPSAAPAALPAGPMTWHGRDIVVASKTAAIFWGRQWDDPNFTQHKIAAIDSFFQGWSNSDYAKVPTEYTGQNYVGATDMVTAASTYLGHVIDLTPAPTEVSPADQSGLVMEETVISEVCNVVGLPDPTTLYVVYATTVPGTGTYGGFHTFGNCQHQPVMVALVLNLDNPAYGIGDSFTGHSAGLAVIADVTAHELAETITDPRGTSWFATSGAGEIGDKCAFAPGGGTATADTTFVTFSNGSHWHIQPLWSNHAYSLSAGYPNNNGVLGCIFHQSA